MLVNITQFYSGGKRHLKETTSEKSLPLSFHPMTQSNNRYIERPLKNNSENLSFKGLSFMGAEKEEPKKKSSVNPTLIFLGVIAAAGFGLRLAPAYKKPQKFVVSEFNEFIGKHDKSLKSISDKLINHLKESKFAKKMVQINGDEISISQKTVSQLIWDGLKYPFTVLPGDLLNGSVELLGKIKPLKGWSEKILEKPMFKNIRQRSKVEAQVNSLLGLFETKKDLSSKLSKGVLTESEVVSELHQRSVKMFDTQKYGAYDTKHERTLNRLVSGLPPAIFLANDAYNLSSMMDNDSKKAEKEKKSRFSQEVTRIFTSGYLTLVTLGALNKYINNSKAGIMLMTGATVLVTEAFSRLSNGKHIKRLTPEEARLENEKNNSPEMNIKPDMSFKSNPENKEKEKPQQKPLLSFGILMKASAAVIAAGFGIRGLRKHSVGIEKMFRTVQEPFEKLYKKLTIIPDYTIPKEKFSKIITVLKENGYENLAVKYMKDAADVTDRFGVIHLGAKDKRFAKPVVNFVIAPFKFIYNTVTLPYRLADKLVKMVVKKPPVVQKTVENLAKELKQKDIEVLAKTIENIGNEAIKKGMTPKKFQSYVEDNILKAFNVTTMSNVSNAELSNLAKTAAAAATLWFLMTDNYNMVMLKSNGNDKSGAETKFKERFVQEGSRLFYQTLLIDLFNSTFRGQYNGSLLGMSWITLTNTTLGEWLTRKSVGMPVKSHTREELQSIEDRQSNGHVKGFYNFMQRLTGKRSIKTYDVTKKDDVAKEQVQKNTPDVNFTNGSNVFNRIIKA